MLQIKVARPYAKRYVLSTCVKSTNIATDVYESVKGKDGVCSATGIITGSAFLILQYVTDASFLNSNTATQKNAANNWSDPIQRCPLDTMNFCRNSFNSETLSLFL